MRSLIVSLSSTLLMASLPLGLMTGCSLIGLGKSKPAAKPAAAQEDTRRDEAPRGELHRASAGKIVFGSSPIAADAKDHQPERLRIDQPIHHRAFQTASAATLFAEADGATCGLAAWRQFVATLSVDGGPASVVRIWKVGEPTWMTGTSTTLTKSGTLLPEELVLPRGGHTVDAAMALALSKLRDGEHKLTLELRARCGEGEGVFLARGELEVLVDAKGRALLDRIVKLMPALKTDQDAKRLANAAKRVFSPGRVRDFRVLDRDYRIKTGATRVPLSRSLVVAAVVEQGGACTLRLRKVVESYRGNGRFGEPYFDDKLTDVGLGPDDAKADLPVPCDLR